MAVGWDYTQQGADWPGKASDDTFVHCATGSQSPIDLKESFKKVKGGNDMWVSTYDGWNSGNCRRLFGHETVKYSANYGENADGDLADRTVPSNYFTSHYMLDMGSVGSFEVAQFHIHHKSEHTVDGEQMDAEIHWVHMANDATDETGYAVASALGIMFKVGASVSTEVDAASLAFWDWIKSDLDTDTAVDSAEDKGAVETSMNALLQAVDWNNRWSYSGSLTTPNCLTGVQHNVLKTVLPVKEEHI